MLPRIRCGGSAVLLCHVLSLHLITVLCSGCVAPEGVSLQANYVLERVDSSEVLREELSSQTTSFKVPSSKDTETWVRARYFFQNYVSGRPIISDYEFYSDPASTDPLIFQVLRRKSSGGVEYSVACSVKTVDSLGQQGAELNAKNLARFLQSGVLAVELINKPVG